MSFFCEAEEIYHNPSHPPPRVFLRFLTKKSTVYTVVQFKSRPASGSLCLQTHKGGLLCCEACLVSGDMSQLAEWFAFMGDLIIK